jgi:4-amino-4-deoxy-L-arabinose transferase-like glycosyltransferase
MAIRRAWLWIAGAVLADTVLRLRFLNVPLNVDEAGYGAVTRTWARGFALYGDVAWVDRPQGLMGLYRLALWLGDEWAIRMLALIAGVGLVLALAVIAWTIGGPRAAVIAAWLMAVIGPAPHIEGFTANGELLGGAVAAIAIAIGFRWSEYPRTWLLLIAGVVAGLAPLVKQSAFDGVLVVGVIVLVVAYRERDMVAGLVRLGVPAVGIGIPWAAAIVAAALSAPGIGGWWYAIYGYRAQTESLISGDIGFRANLLVKSVPWMLVDVGLILVLVVLGFLAMRRERCLLVPLVWLGACSLGFLAGGLYHPHYWVQLLPPFALFAGIGGIWLWENTTPRVGLAVIGVATAIPLIAATPVYFASTPELASARSTNDPRVISAIGVGNEVARLTGRDDRIQVLWANAAIYWYADRIPATRYLWYRNIERIPGGRQGVVDAFTGDTPPKIAVGYQPVAALDIDGQIQSVLDQRYTTGEVDGQPVWQLEP